MTHIYAKYLRIAALVLALGYISSFMAEWRLMIDALFFEALLLLITMGATALTFCNRLTIKHRIVYVYIFALWVYMISMFVILSKGSIRLAPITELLPSIIIFLATLSYAVGVRSLTSSQDTFTTELTEYKVRKQRDRFVVEGYLSKDMLLKKTTPACCVKVIVKDDGVYFLDDNNTILEYIVWNSIIQTQVIGSVILLRTKKPSIVFIFSEQPSISRSMTQKPNAQRTKVFDEIVARTS